MRGRAWFVAGLVVAFAFTMAALYCFRQAWHAAPWPWITG